MSRFIHLLYVPTMACNMQCKYCYLEENTLELDAQKNPLDTLRYAVEKFKSADVLPFNISLHGGEVTTLSKEAFSELAGFIAAYYDENRKFLQENGFHIGTPHIKTNLYALDKHIEAIEKYQVSVSGSLDLPFSLHDEYRVTKGGQKTLEKILANVRLLERVDNKKKVSATIFREHYARGRDDCGYPISA